MSTKKSRIRIDGFMVSVHHEVKDMIEKLAGSISNGVGIEGELLTFHVQPFNPLCSDDLRSLAALLDKLDGKSMNEGDGKND